VRLERFIHFLREYLFAAGVDARGATANGGALSKYSVGIYAARPATWRALDSGALQATVDAWPAHPRAIGNGEGIVETYTIDYSGKAPLGVIVGRLDGSGARVVAMTVPTGRARRRGPRLPRVPRDPRASVHESGARRLARRLRRRR
jgi:hypothetical protein